MLWSLWLGGLLAVRALAAGPSTNAASVAPPAATLAIPSPAPSGPATNLALPPAWSMDALDDKQKLAVGDKITFRVIEDQDEPKSLMIGDSGEMNVPELGLVKAAGKTCKQLASEVKTKLEQTTYYRATVILGIEQLNTTLSGRKVFVVGEVRITGPQEIPAGEKWTVSKAILRAGGFTSFADKRHVRLIRGGAKTETGQMQTVNVNDIWEKAKTSDDLPVENEDLVYVPSRAVNFR